MRTALLCIVTLVGTSALGVAWSVVAHVSGLGDWWGGWGTGLLQAVAWTAFYRKVL